MSDNRLERTIISFSSAIAACEGSNWERAVRLLELSSKDRLRLGGMNT